ncbi:MAG: bifunctional [glutamine synthetase] adenylyltransferase/[glutamine synthetase]-adenylyl-L-tyrosine phosphorylase [Pseudomonadota bacterium]
MTASSGPSFPEAFGPALAWRAGPCLPFDRELGQQTVEALRTRLSVEDWQGIAPYTDEIANAAGAAPYLRRLMARKPALVVDAFLPQDDHGLSTLTGPGWTSDGAANARALRQAKDRWALRTALRDLAGLTPVMTAAASLSRFACAAIDTALTLAWRAHRHTLGDEVRGLTVLAMGKLGASELNYSSDVDLIVLYDPEKLTLVDGADAKSICVGITRVFLALLSDQTADGYVFRTDLRLRPDPGVTAVAVCVGVAEHYYEGYGQTWERLAFIKARPVGGDKALGQSFLKAIQPFIWRRNLDYAAVEDVHQIREKIMRTHGQGLDGDSGLAGHNVKLGVGGIREIEFFAQTHQIIAGGKDPDLRVRDTLRALTQLAAAGLIPAPTATALSAAYPFMRFVEHRLQMINDEQCHTVGTDQVALEQLAALCGFEEVSALQKVHASAITMTRTAYDGLFSVTQSPIRSAKPEAVGADQNTISSLDFVGPAPGSETLSALAALGFEQPAEVDRIIRQWMRGDLPATRVDQARRLLRNLIPDILGTMAHAPDPYQTLLAFDRFLATLPAGVQLFSMLNHHEPVLKKLMMLLTASPRLATDLSRYRHIIESLIENNPFSDDHHLVSTATMTRYLTEAIGDDVPDGDLETVMDTLARHVGEARFGIAADLVGGSLTPAEAGLRFTRVARACLETLMPFVTAAMPGAEVSKDDPYTERLAVLGFGRLGAGRMSFQSDLDLVFVFDPQKETGNAAYARFVRKMITVLTTPMRDGVLYPVDMQLRPSGRAGPVATSLNAFHQYYDHDAWVWEFMALTKARVIAGAKPLGAHLTERIQKILRQPRDRAEVASAVRDMRTRLLTARPAISVWDRKLVAGGQTDIEFLTQCLTLTHANTLGLPPSDVPGQFVFFADEEVLTNNEAAKLADCYGRNEAIMQYGRLGNGEVFSPIADGPVLGDLIAKACGVRTVAETERVLEDDAAFVKAVFTRIVGG